METIQTEVLHRRFQKRRERQGDIFIKCYEFETADDVRRSGYYPYFCPVDETEGPTAVIDGTRVLMMGSNNYLGLTTDPEVKEAAGKAINRYGTSSSGSRFLNGTFRLHEKLEEELAEFTGKPCALVFSTGFQTNLGILSALLSEEDYAVIDKYDHTSIRDGISLSGAKVVKFDHNSASDLDEKLSGLPEESSKLVIVDGVYSMEGDIADVPSILPVIRGHKARFMIDDAHSLGILGEGGRGTANHFGVTDHVDIIMGTFSKSFASIGGFAAGETKVIDYIKHFAHSMIFSAALPPVNVQVVRTALKILRREPERVEKLNENGRYFKKGLQELGFDTGNSNTPVIPVVIGEESLTLGIWKTLFQHGVYTNSVLYPAVPKNRAMLRTSCMATHEKQHLDKALQVFAKVGKACGIIK